MAEESKQYQITFLCPYISFAINSFTYVFPSPHFIHAPNQLVSQVHCGGLRYCNLLLAFPLHSQKLEYLELQYVGTYIHFRFWSAYLGAGESCLLKLSSL